VLAIRFRREGLQFDMTRSLRSGALHFLSDRRPIAPGVPGTVDGVTDGSIVILSRYALDPNRTETHEVVHVKQQWFLAQNISKPIESAIRQEWHIFRVIPAWIDPGVAWPFVSFLEQQVAGSRRGPLFRLQESEAELYERLRKRAE
jgi:hypothetical protein